MKLPRKSDGHSLVELLISMTLGLIIIAGCLQIFLSIKQIWQAQQALARLQENGRILHDSLNKAIQSSGNMGCNVLADILTIKKHGNISLEHYGFVPNQGIVEISFNELTKNPLVSPSVLQRIIPESNILWIKSIKRQYRLKSAFDTNENNLLVLGHPHFQENEVILVSDCSHLDFVKVMALKKQGKLHQITLANSIVGRCKFGKIYQPGAVVASIASSLFYIGDTKRKNATGAPIHSLYHTDLNGRTMELVEGLEYFEVFFGIKNNGTLFYFTYDQIKDKQQQIASIRILALLNSIEDGLMKPQVYIMHNEKHLPSDRLMRMWWTYEWPLKFKGSDFLKEAS